MIQAFLSHPAHLLFFSPETKSQVIMPNDPSSIEGRRPHLSRYRIAGSVKATLITYWIDAVARGEAIWAELEHTNH